MKITVTQKRLGLTVRQTILNLTISKAIVLGRSVVENAGYSKPVNGETVVIIRATEHGMSKVRNVTFWGLDGWEQSVLPRRMPNGDVLVQCDGLTGTIELT
jgi:hypothetical protein